MANVNVLEALMGTHVDLSGAEEGLGKFEKMAETTTKNVAGKFSLMSLGIATAVVGTVVVALEKAIKTTADWGLEMEHLGNRMGMTSQQAATLVGVMERYGIQGGVAARSMQIMAMEAKQTTDALDPFATKMGRVLGTLRDTNGQALNMSQVLDLARQKIAGAASETEKLQIAQSLVGTRMAGQLLPILKLTNEEWAKQKASVEAAQGPVNEAAKQALAYKEATAGLEQTFRGLEITLGTKLLPILTELVNRVTDTIHWFEQFGKVHPVLASLVNPISFIVDQFKTLDTAVEAVFFEILKGAEVLHLVAKGTADAFANMEQVQKDAQGAAAAQHDLADATGETASAAEVTEKREKELVQIATQRLHLAEEARKLGMGDQAGIEVAAQERLLQLEEQRAKIRKEMAAPGLSSDNMKKLQEDLMKNQVEAAQTVAKIAEDQYSSEELHLKANGAMNLNNEIQLLEKKLQDERIVGDERLKVEAEVYQKRQQYMEEAVKVGRDLGIISVDAEINYRKSKAADLLGKGDAIGAGQELVKARDMAIKQADEQMEFVKKLHVVSLQDEISYQRQKLELIKGNASEEMKVLGQIADLDKKLYDERLQFGLNYTGNIMSALKQLSDAQEKAKMGQGGESMTFGRARSEAERQLPQVTRMLTEVGEHGGTEAERGAAVQQAQKIQETFQKMEETGTHISNDWRDAEKAAEGLLKAASGGEEVRAPGGPSPTVGSIMGSVEGLATQGLARGTDIPRLDTSFTDLATRIRDVLLGTIPNLTNFSNAVGTTAQKIAGITGMQLGPGGIGPGAGASMGSQTQGSGELPTGTGTPAPSTVGPGGAPVAPASVVGVTSTGGASGGGSDAIVAAIKELKDTLSTAQQAAADAQSQAAANQEQLTNAVRDVLTARPANSQVTVSVDPNTGDLLAQSIVKQLQ